MTKSYYQKMCLKNQDQLDCYEIDKNGKLKVDYWNSTSETTRNIKIFQVSQSHDQ